MKNYFLRVKKLWYNQCPATRVLIILGSITFLSISLSVITDRDISKPSNITIRSINASIFGYIFGDKISVDSDFPSIKLQAVIASIVSFVTLGILILSNWIDINQTGPSFVELRNLLCAAIGFLISRCRHKPYTS